MNDNLCACVFEWVSDNHWPPTQNRHHHHQRRRLRRQQHRLESFVSLQIVSRFFIFPSSSSSSSSCLQSPFKSFASNSTSLLLWPLLCIRSFEQNIYFLWWWWWTHPFPSESCRHFELLVLVVRTWTSYTIQSWQTVYVCVCFKSSIGQHLPFLSFPFRLCTIEWTYEYERHIFIEKL